MSNIKVANTASEPAVNAEKEFQLVKQQQEIRGSESLFQKLSQTITKQREEADKAREDDQQVQQGDTAEISEARRRFPANETSSMDDSLRWMLELEEKDWKLLLEWQPDPSLDLSKQLQELSKLYLTLLEATLKYAEGENLAEQLARLDALLAQKLSLVMDQNLEQLTLLLEKTGQGAELDSIRSGLYRQTAGRILSLHAAHTLFSQVKPVSSRSSREFSAPSSHSREGMVYQSSGRQNIRFQQAYHTQENSWKEQLRQREEIINNARTGITKNAFKQESSVSSSGRELERANRFAAHIRGSGNLFNNPGISARNEEVTGLMAAVMSMKGQVYAGEIRQSSSLTFALENAIEKIISPYLSGKGASKVYYHTLAAYKQTQSPEKAIEDGQDYAYRQFQAKQKDPAFQRSPHYSKESGFFQALAKGLSPEKAFAMGINILEKDWQNFLYAIGNRQNSSYLSRAQIYSPWGALAGAGTHGAGRDGSAGKILTCAAAAIILSALAVMYFRFI